METSAKTAANVEEVCFNVGIYNMLNLDFDCIGIHKHSKRDSY